MNKIQAKEIIGGDLSATTKMPCKSFNLPAWECKTGSKLAKIPGTVCHGCYAMKGNYTRFPSVKKAQYKRLGQLFNPTWVDAMVSMIERENNPYFRWHDAGDVRTVEHFAKICEIAVMSPHIRHWIPTRENKIINQYVREGGFIPDNLCVRLSAPMVDQKPVHTNDYNTSTVHSNIGRSSAIANWKGKECQAYRTSKDGKIMAREVYRTLTKEDKKEYDFGYCGDCRDCWSKEIDNVSYFKH